MSTTQHDRPRLSTAAAIARLYPYAKPAMPRIYLGMVAALLAGVVAELDAAGTSADQRELLSSVPIAGLTGTLEERFTDPEDALGRGLVRGDVVDAFDDPKTPRIHAVMDDSEISSFAATKAHGSARRQHAVALVPTERLVVPGTRYSPSLLSVADTLPPYVP